jgi:hypothetical protein
MHVNEYNMKYHRLHMGIMYSTYKLCDHGYRVYIKHRLFNSQQQSYIVISAHNIHIFKSTSFFVHKKPPNKYVHKFCFVFFSAEKYLLGVWCTSPGAC